MGFFNIGVFLEIQKIALIWTCLISVILKYNSILKSININYLLVGSSVLLFRLLFPFSFPYLINISCPLFFKRLYDIFYTPILYTNIKIYHIIIFICMFVAAKKLFFFIREYFKYKNLLFLMAQHQNANHYQETLLKQLLDKYNIKRNVRIVISDQFHHPFIFGLHDTIIGLPDKQYSNMDLHHILTHEINHLKYHHNYIKLFIEILNILYWWNPILYTLKRQIAKVIEISADTESVKHLDHQNRLAYLNCLLNEAKNYNNINQVFSLSLISENKSFLHFRFCLILHENRNIRYIKLIFCCTILLLLVLTFTISINPLV